MTEAYTRYLEEKLVKVETAARFTSKRLHEIVLSYDKPFLPDDMRNMMAEINRLKNIIDDYIYKSNDATN